MNLSDINSGDPSNPQYKSWFNPICNNMTCEVLSAQVANIADIVVEDLSANLLTLNNQSSVPNPPIGATSFYSTGFNNLTQINPTGGLVTFATSGSVENAVLSNGSPSVAHNLPYYDDTSGLLVSDSGISASSLSGAPFLPLSGGVMSGPIDLSATHIQVGNSGNFNVNAMATGSSDVLISFFGSSASGDNEIVIGAQNSATEQYEVVIGDGIHATGFGSVNLGGGDTGITNPQAHSVAIGTDLVLGAGSGGICIGDAASIGAFTDVISMGHNAACNANNSLSIGGGSSVSNANAIALGDSSSVGAGAMFGIALGNGASVSGTSGICIAANTNNPNDESCIIGDNGFTDISSGSATCDLGAARPFRFVNSIGLKVVQGANALSGTGAALVGGTVTVATTAVNTGDSVFLSRTAVGGTPGIEYISAINNGVSFVISSTNSLDTSSFSWLIVKPA